MGYHGGHTTPALGTIERNLNWLIADVERIARSGNVGLFFDRLEEREAELQDTLIDRYPTPTPTQAVTIDRVRAKIERGRATVVAIMRDRCAEIGVDVDEDRCDWAFVAIMLAEIAEVPADELDAAVRAVNDGARVSDRGSY